MEVSGQLHVSATLPPRKESGPKGEKLRGVRKRRMRKMGNKILVAKLEGKRSLGRRKHRREGSIKPFLSKWVVRVSTGFTWLRIGSSGGLF
jgi:hypothetical protein